MTVADTIQSMKAHMRAAYDVIEEMGGTRPEELNLENLPAAIATIEKKIPIGPWGRVIYFTNSEINGVALQTEEDFNALCTNGNLNSQITVQGATFTKYAVIQFEFGEKFPTAIPDYFLYYFTSVGVSKAVTIPSGVTSIGNYFMARCSTYNFAMTLPATITSIGTYFRAYNYGASSVPDISKTKITLIPASFLSCCYAMTGALVIPEGVTGISSYFLAYCSIFNGAITFPSTLKLIGDHFLAYCRSFNKPITITSGVTDLGSYFMFYTTSFSARLQITGGNGIIGDSFLRSSYLAYTTGAEIILDGTWVSIGDFFCYAAFYLNIPISITGNDLAIGNQFLYRAALLNSNLTLSGVKSIGNYFMSRCIAFAKQLTFDEHLTTIGTNFMEYCIGITTLPPDLSKTKLTDIPQSFMYACVSMTTAPVLPTSLKTIGNFFLYRCLGLESTVTIPSGVTSIGTNFMAWCGSYYRPLRLPDGLTSIGEFFMYRDGAFLGPLTVPASLTNLPASDYTLAVLDTTAPTYKIGITITGDGAANFKAAYPDINSSTKRKLIVSNTATASEEPVTMSTRKQVAEDQAGILAPVVFPDPPEPPEPPEPPLENEIVKNS